MNREKTKNFESIRDSLNYHGLTENKKPVANDRESTSDFFKTNIRYFDESAKANRDFRIIRYGIDACLEINRRLANGENVGSSELF